MACQWCAVRGAWTRSVCHGQPILLLLLQSHLAHYQLVCLAELQYQNLPSWSYDILSSGCHSCTNLNFMVI